MGLGDMLGKVVEAAGGLDEIVAKVQDSDIDIAALASMDLEAVTGALGDLGIDLSMLEGLGISVEDLIAKLTE